MTKVVLTVEQLAEVWQINPPKLSRDKLHATTGTSNAALGKGAFRSASSANVLIGSMAGHNTKGA